MSPCGLGWWVLIFLSMINIIWNSVSIWPIFVYAKFKQGWWFRFSSFLISSEYLVSWCCSKKMWNCKMILIYSIFQNLYMGFSCSLAKVFSEPLAKYFCGHVTFSSVHCSKSKSQNFLQKKDNFRYVFIHKKADTLRAYPRYLKTREKKRHKKSKRSNVK